MKLQVSPATGMVRPARMEGKIWDKVSNATRQNNELRFKIYKRGRFNIHLKVMRPNTPLMKGKKEKKWGQFDILSVIAKPKISFQSIRQCAQFIWEVTSDRMEAN
jgi:hypothetical protein